jgi:hypothetical protein
MEPAWFLAREKTLDPHLLFLAILFQSFFKIALSSELWNVVDVIVGIGLIASIFIKQKPAKFEP